jgi:Ran GTPase-activating protein (RanGAP) involved in mRNA processing and transport
MSISLTSSSSSIDETQPLTQSVTVVALLPENIQSRLPSLLPTLSSLNLTNCGLDLSTAKFLGEILSQNTTILVLDLSLNRLTSQGGKAIMEGLMTNSTLTSLNLSNCFLTAAFGKHCASLLTTNTTIRSLNLSKNLLKFGGQEIINSLTSNVTLDELNLSKCGLNAPLAHSISVMLITNTSLKSLDLSDNNFGSTEAVGQHFATAIQTNLTLVTLCLRNTRLGLKARRRILRAAAPGCMSMEVQLSPMTLVHPVLQPTPSPPPTSIRRRMMRRQVNDPWEDRWPSSSQDPFGDDNNHNDPFGGDDYNNDPFSW